MKGAITLLGLGDENVIGVGISIGVLVSDYRCFQGYGLCLAVR